MKISELKLLLNEYPDDLLVVVDGYEGGFSNIKTPMLVVVKKRIAYSWEEVYALSHPAHNGDVALHLPR
jgi:hypothetical protein